MDNMCETGKTPKQFTFPMPQTYILCKLASPLPSSTTHLHYPLPPLISTTRLHHPFPLLASTTHLHYQSPPSISTTRLNHPPLIRIPRSHSTLSSGSPPISVAVILFSIYPPMIRSSTVCLPFVPRVHPTLADSYQRPPSAPQFIACLLVHNIC